MVLRVWIGQIPDQQDVFEASIPHSLDWSLTKCLVLEHRPGDPLIGPLSVMNLLVFSISSHGNAKRGLSSVRNLILTVHDQEETSHSSEIAFALESSVLMSVNLARKACVSSNRLLGYGGTRSRHMNGLATIEVLEGGFE